MNYDELSDAEVARRLLAAQQEIARLNVQIRDAQFAIVAQQRLAYNLEVAQDMRDLAHKEHTP
jgi:tmRNA-binding protein